MVAASADFVAPLQLKKQPGPEADPNGSVPESARSQQKRRNQAAATDRADWKTVCLSDRCRCDRAMKTA